MLIVCPTCSASYEVALAKLAPRGRSVRCTRCKGVWFAATPVEVSAPVHAAALSAGLGAGTAESHSGRNETSGFTPAGDANHALPPQPERPAATDYPIAGLPVLAPGTNAAESSTAIALIDAPSIVPAGAAEPATIDITPAESPRADIETLAARRRRKVAARKRAAPMRAGLAIIILALVALMGGLVAWRNQVVQFVPQAASLFKAIGLTVNLRGLAIENVKTMREVQDGVMVLIVEGTVANVVNRPVEVPRLRFALRSPAGLEIYAWTAMTGRTVLGAGESTGFRTRLASPPADGREVVIRFFHRRDIAAGLR